jgi:RND superfamily putative drug exporter
MNRRVSTLPPADVIDDRPATSTRSLAGFVAGARTKYLVLAFWLAVTLIAAGFAGRLSGVEKDDAKSMLPGNAESTRVLDIQSSFTPPGTIPAVVVYERPPGLTATDRMKIGADATAFGRRTDLDGTVDRPTFAADGTAAQIVVPLNLGHGAFTKAGDVVATMRDTAQRDANGLSVHIAGPAGVAADQSRAVAGLDTRLLLATAAVVVVILLLTYRSPLLWVLPVVSSGVALAAAEAVVYLLAKYAGLTVTADGAFILTILVFGAGTDYALLLIARYREELRSHRDRHVAMAAALRRCGPAIAASAGTVAAGMLCLLVADTNSIKGFGPVFATGVLVGLAAMLTLFPALLVTVGRWVFWPRRPQYDIAQSATAGGWARLGARIARRPRIIWAVTALALAAMAFGLTQLNATGLTDDQAFRGHHDSAAGAQALARHFPAGAGSPIVITSTAQQAAQVRTALASTRGIETASVTQPVIKGDLAYLEATLTDPPDSSAAHDTVDRARANVHAVPAAHAQVGGDPAIKLDVQRAARHDAQRIVPIVLAMVLLILVVLLRAVVAPLVLLATVVLSFAAALGASALVFRHLFGYRAEDSTFPLSVFVFLVALGIDYNIFLITRVREETARYGTRQAALSGLAVTGGVITSAGLVLAATFAVLATLPLTVATELGFAIAFGILLDTTVVRSVLVTALTLDIGRHMWWPSRLSRPTGHEAAC